MLIPKDIEGKLGFDRIRQILQEGCQSVQGKEQVGDMTFTSSPWHLRSLHLQTSEFLNILLAGETLPLQHIHDLREYVKKSGTIGTFLQPEEFLKVVESIDAGATLYRFLSGRRSEFPNLFEIVQDLGDHSAVRKEIQAKISEDGQVKSGASPELQRIRRSMDQARTKLRKDLDRIFRDAVKNGMVPEKASVTIRDGRMVIPVLAEYKRRIKGFVHDESATGQTVYMEPAEVLESNNELRELEYAERREIVKILITLTDIIRPYASSLNHLTHLLGTFDFIRSKARLARELDAVLPSSAETSSIVLNNARHPLLYLNFKNTQRQVVPVSLRINSEMRLIIISGPNAGGKSVCLKTTGLIQYMWQTGLLVPVDETSEMGIFDSVFLDIGDEQSIENDLSTYSSHLTLMKKFMDHANERSLVLIDEFGTGTDPQYGGAIAESILDKLVSLQCRGIITTHYGNIKSYAEKHSEVINGAMKYDVEHLEPLYQLQIGIPGSSFSFEVARKIGLPGAIIEYARKLIGEKQFNVDELILKLEKQEQQIRERDLSLRKKEEEVEKLRSQYESLADELKENKKEIIGKAREEARRLLSETNREIEKTIRHIKENKAEKKETKRMRERLDSLKKKVSVEDKENKQAAAENIKTGDSVRLMGKDVTGEVLSVRGNTIEVQVGALKTLVKKNQLEKISRSEARKTSRSTGIISSNVDMNQRLAGFSHSIDLRGKRADEAMMLTEKFIDDALLFNARELRILHGKGDGILRQRLRELLRANPYVESVNDEHVERGGAGISIVTLK